jgi:hypothetical protein
MVVQRAGVIVAGLGDVELRHRCRTAPEFIRANIDARRASRGLSALWPELRRRDVSRSAPRRVRFWRAFLAAYGHRG